MYCSITVVGRFLARYLDLGVVNRRGAEDAEVLREVLWGLGGSVVVWLMQSESGIGSGSRFPPLRERRVFA